MKEEESVFIEEDEDTYIQQKGSQGFNTRKKKQTFFCYSFFLATVHSKILFLVFTTLESEDRFFLKALKPTEKDQSFYLQV